MRVCTNRSTILLTACIFFSALHCFSQGPVKEFNATSFTEEEYQLIKKERGLNKTIPLQYEKQILLALSYFPELSPIHIEFRLKPAYSALSTRPSWLSTLDKGKNRTYIITICTSTIPALMPLLLNNMEFNAQVGVLGHELSHVADFISKKPLAMLRVGFGNLSQHFLDKMEYKTDSICIAHGLGYQLLAWSKFVRQTLHQSNWEGAGNIKHTVMTKERYMNPGTIEKRISELEIYRETR